MGCVYDTTQLGASLAQDRGRMQAKLEALDHEVLQLNNDNVQLKDQLRVQHKICDDHNDSILQLKQVCYHVTMVTVTCHSYC